MKRNISRRQMLKTAALGAGGVVLAACTQATPQVIKETVVVEKEKQVEVTKEVEKQVEVTKEVEKVVEQTVQVEVTTAPVGASSMTVWGSGLHLTLMDKDPKGRGLSLIMLPFRLFRSIGHPPDGARPPLVAGEGRWLTRARRRTHPCVRLYPLASGCHPRT